MASARRFSTESPLQPVSVARSDEARRRRCRQEMRMGLLSAGAVLPAACPEDLPHNPDVAGSELRAGCVDCLGRLRLDQARRPRTESHTSNMKLCVAPMMDWTDRHCRFFHRLLSGRARLYTEMVTAEALLHGHR